MAPSAKLKRQHAKHCKRTLKAGTLTRASEPQGVDQIAFTGRIGNHRLKAGAYTATLQATNAGGRSNRVRLKFKIVA